VFASPGRKGLRGTERVGRGRDMDMDMERWFGGREVVMGRGGVETGVARARGCRMCLLGLGRCWAFENLRPPALESPERKDALLSSCCVVQIRRRKGWMGVAWGLSSCLLLFSAVCVCVRRCRKIWIFIYRVQ